MTQTPSIGRIVHVIVDPDRNNGAPRAAAVITKVHHEGLVNVRPFHDRSTSSELDAITSLPLYQSEADAVAARDAMVKAHTEAHDGQAPDLTHVHYGYWPETTGPAPVTRAEYENLQNEVAALRERLAAFEKPAETTKPAGRRKSPANEETDETGQDDEAAA